MGAHPEIQIDAAFIFTRTDFINVFSLAHPHGEVYGRGDGLGCGEGRGRGVGWGRPSGGVGVGVAVGVGVGGCAQYLPPVLVGPVPPQTIISLPVQTAVCWYRSSGASVMLVAVQLSMLGL